jgi:hypothetical protein
MLSSHLRTDLPSVGFSRQVHRLNVLYAHLYVFIYTSIHTFKSIYTFKSKKYIKRIKLRQCLILCENLNIPWQQIFLVSSTFRASPKYITANISSETLNHRQAALNYFLFLQNSDRNICPAIIRFPKYKYMTTNRNSKVKETTKTKCR